MGLGGTSYADFISNMHLPMQLRYDVDVIYYITYVSSLFFFPCSFPLSIQALKVGPIIHLREMNYYLFVMKWENYNGYYLPLYVIYYYLTFTLMIFVYLQL